MNFYEKYPSILFCCPKSLSFPVIVAFALNIYDFSSKLSQSHLLIFQLYASENHLISYHVCLFIRAKMLEKSFTLKFSHKGRLGG